MMTKRHNMLASVVRKGIDIFLVNDLRSAIQENEAIREEGLSDEMRRMRPDMVFGRRRARAVAAVKFYADEAERRNEEKAIEILEFSCPYGYVSHGRNTLEKEYEEKKRKYTELARNLKRLGREEVRVTSVIVSSMGAVDDQSLKDPQKVLGCTD
jgi:hypothetical protein